MPLGDTIARLSVSLGIETAAFERGATLAEKRMAQTQRKFAKLGDQIGNVGQKMSLAVTAPIAALGTLSFKAAMDAQEMGSAFEVVFGKASADVRKWADETGAAMGRSSTRLQETAMQFQEFFGKAASPAASVKLSKTFAVLTRDLASFKNLSDEVAQQKLLSGLAGEAEPLRQVGVFLSAAKVEAAALALGYEKVNGQFTEEQKILARSVVIREQLSKANGDVMRTSESTANQLKASQDAFYDLQIVIGTKLLPALTPLIVKLGEMLQWFTSLPQPIQDTIVVVAGIAAAIGPLLMVVGQLTTAVPLLAKALTFLFAHPIILGAAALIGGIYLAWKNWDKITAIVQSVYQGVKTWLMDKLGSVLDWVRKKVEMVEGAFRWLWDKVVGNSWVPDMVTGVAAEFAKLDGVMVRPALAATGKVNAAFAGLASIPSGLGPMAPGNGIPGALEALGGAANDNADTVEAANVRVVQSFKDMAQKTLDSLGNLFDAIKGGGFLDILEGVLNLGLQFASIGVFGKKIAANVNKVPGNANGTRNWGGGLSWVGERGPELVNMPRGSQVFTNRESMGMMGGKLQVEVVANNNGFGAIIRNHAGQVVAEAAPSLMGGSAQLAGQQAMQARSRRLA